MKICYQLLLFIIVLINNPYAQEQQKKLPLLYEPFISIGYMNASTNLASDYYNIIVDSYRSRGVPVPTQVNFGHAITANGGVYFGLLKKISAGFGVGYIYSNAHSNYKDYEGTLKVNGSIESYKISFIAKGTLYNIINYPLILFNEISLNYTSAVILQDLTFDNYSNSNSHKKWAVNSWGPSGQLGIGTEFQFGMLTLSPQVGYHLSMNLVSSEVNKVIYIEYGTNFDNRKNIGYSGFIFSVKLGMNFSKSRN
jgi:hypothetical protein